MRSQMTTLSPPAIDPSPPAIDPSHHLREPARGAVAYPALAALPGVEQVRAFLAGRAPAPPVARLTGRRIVDASVGSVTYALQASDWMVGPQGVVHPGVLAMLADISSFATVVSALPARVPCRTAELSMTFLGSPPSAEGEITARGRLLHVDEQMGLAEVHVRDARDRLVAHGMSRCSVFPPIDESIAMVPPGESRTGGTEPGRPDPHLRAAPAAARGAHKSRDGIDLLRAELHGELPPPPIDLLTGIRLVGAERGRVVFGLPASPWLRGEWGTVHGGVLTLLAKSAAAAAAQTTATAGTSFAARDIKVNFLRAVPADGRELRATGTVLHRGKRLAIATAEVMHGDERVAVLTGTTALAPPARPRSTHRRSRLGLPIRNAAAGADTSDTTSLALANAGALW